MLRRMLPFLLACILTSGMNAQDLAGIEIHGFATQDFLYSSHNNYLSMNSNSGSLQWTDGAVSVTDSVTDKLRIGIELHVDQLGQLGGPNFKVDWGSGDYRVSDYLGFRAGKVKTVLGLFNDSQDVNPLFLWILLPQSTYPIDNESFFLSHLGGEVYGEIPLGDRVGTLRYSGYVGNNSLDLNGGYLKQLAELGLVFNTAPAGTTYGGDLRWKAPSTRLTVGGSTDVQALDGTAAVGGIHLPPAMVYAAYSQYKRGRFYFAGEYRREPTSIQVTLGPLTFPVPKDEHTWYVMGSFRPAKKLTVGSYYSHFVNKTGDMGQPANYSKDWVASGRYDFNPYFYGKIEGHCLHGTAIGYYDSDNPNGLKPNSNMLALSTGFSF